MPAFDASSFIRAWDEYPIGQFPKVWDWLKDEVDAQQIVVASVALGEIAKNSPQCHQWLVRASVRELKVTNDVAQFASTILAVLQIPNADYHPKGVGENDVFIIAAAKVHNLELITDEGRQSQRPKTLAKCKIPAVCEFPQVGVACDNFVGYLKRSKRVF